MPPARSKESAVAEGHALVAAVAWLALASVCLLAPPHAGAQALMQPQAKPRIGTPVLPVQDGVHWSDLTPAQQGTLRPLERDWGAISAYQRQKWLEIAARFPTLQPSEKARIQARMTEWAKLTTEQRQQARVNYQQAKKVAPQDRRSQWEAYQSLPPEEKSKLAARAAPREAAGNLKRERTDLSDRMGLSAQPSKTNIVPNPAFAAPPRTVAPTVQQAQPGATTTLISRIPAPPAHQQTGLPKIGGGSNFVDKATLLPQRGPQGAAAARSAAASAPEAPPRR
jgi:hypothetical protein